MCIRAETRARIPGLESAKRKEFEEFVQVYASDIVDKWVDYFVKKKHIAPQIITKKIKNARAVD